MTATCPLNSVGQSASLVMRKSAVRIRKGAQIIQPTSVGFFMPKTRIREIIRETKTFGDSAVALLHYNLG